MQRWINPWGALVALVGFAVTRFFVAESVSVGGTLPYFVAGITPLVVGLGVTVYGVVLALGPYRNDHVRTVARWCVLGTVTMVGVLVVTSLDLLLRGGGLRVLSESGLLVANIVLSGTVGGALVGVKSSRNRRHRREIKRQANRVLLLDRMLRHEVINAATVIDGHAELLATADSAREASASEIRDASSRIVETIDVVGELTDVGGVHPETAVGEAVTTEAARVERSFPDVTVDVEPPDDRPVVAADHARMVYRELLENAAEHGASRVEVGVSVGNGEVSVTVRDDGPGLPDAQRRLLLSGAFPEYDDPTAGFGLQIVRLLVVRSDGRIHLGAGIDGAGQSVTVTFPRADTPDRNRLLTVESPDLYRAVGAGLLAGVAMGGLFSATTDVLPVIGSLYGVENPVVGWVTHLFHSVVFALLFAAGRSHPRVGLGADGPVRGALAGVAWGTLLWLVAAGVVMPVWLQWAGVPAPLPNLPRLGFLSHALWGTVLGVSYDLLGRFDTRLGPVSSAVSSFAASRKS